MESIETQDKLQLFHLACRVIAILSFIIGTFFFSHFLIDENSLNFEIIIVFLISAVVVNSITLMMQLFNFFNAEGLDYREMCISLLAIAINIPIAFLYLFLVIVFN
jgi:hypothetical protein